MRSLLKATLGAAAVLLLIVFVLVVSAFVTTDPAAAPPGGAGGGRGISGANEVTITRDDYGVPHIYSNDTYGLFYGYGYAIAQDRLFQMEMAKRTVLGTVAEVLGEDYLEFDKQIRSNYSPDLVRAQYEELTAKDKEIFQGYADGMNAWIAEVEDNRGDLLPKQFTDFGFDPGSWEPFDVVMIFVGTMANRFSDFNTEIDNLEFLGYLMGEYGEEVGWEFFEQTKWLNDPVAPTTVPPGGETAAGFGLSSHRRTLANLARSAASEAGPSDRRFDPAQLPLTSNIWMVSGEKTEGKSAIMVNGPQFGWFNPGYVYEVGLHGAGFDLTGNTPFGYPVILFGHNKHAAWGSTAGLGDVVDIYAETLNPADPHQYWHDGEWKTMEHRTETIEVKDGDPVTIDIYRTVHGLVVEFDTEADVAYSKKRSWEGYEVESLMGWIESTQAANYAQWESAASKMALTINSYYADRRGNIGYIHTGRYPVRPATQDVRLPASGEGDMEWLGILPFEENPQVLNPEQGYIANWNNKPAVFWDDSDMWWLTWGSADRVDTIFEELESEDTFTREEAWAVNERLSFEDVNIDYFLPFLEEAADLSGATAREKEAVERLTEWDQYRRDQDRDGYYDSPAQTIMQGWLPNMLEATFADDFGAYFWRVASAGYPTSPPGGSTNVQTGSKILYHSLLGPDSSVPNDYDFFNGTDSLEVVLAALQTTLDELETKFGTNDMDDWLLQTVPQHFVTRNFNGIPQANPGELLTLPVNMNRGTENHLVSLSPGDVSGWDVCPPGQSGFVAPDGTRSPHYDDQLGLYDDFELKPMNFSYSDVQSSMESTVTLRY